jgi:hypothetical protein
MEKANKTKGASGTRRQECGQCHTTQEHVSCGKEFTFVLKSKWKKTKGFKLMSERSVHLGHVTSS